MTKVEAIQFLQGQSNDIIEQIANKISDEMLLNSWNHNDQMDNKGLRLIKVGNEFLIESYVPLCVFTKDAMEYFLNN
jgi:hypothetical protein